MDGHRFDDLVRNLADGLSRRKIVQGLAVSLAGAGLTFANRDLSEANNGKAKGKKKQCNKEKCEAKGPGRKCCGRNCVNTNNNGRHCGKCNNKCKGSRICRTGQCRRDT